MRGERLGNARVLGSRSPFGTWNARFLEFCSNSGSHGRQTVGVRLPNASRPRSGERGYEWSQTDYYPLPLPLSIQMTELQPDQIANQPRQPAAATERLLRE